LETAGASYDLTGVLDLVSGNVTMKRKQKTSVGIAVFLVAFVAGLLIYPALCRKSHRNGLQFINEPSSAKYMVVVTHGWIEKGDDWPRDMAQAIGGRVDSNQWLCGYFDWSKGARTINPADAAQYARDIAGAALAGQILELNGNLKHIHLIGHSSGCWAVSEAAKILARQTKTDIHLTFFDAYVPKSFSADSIGDINAPADVNFWADHYYTRDYTGELTAQDLVHAHNVDLTEIDQLMKDHNFPWKWYYATVTGSFPRHSLMDNEKLVTDVNGVDYGFARSREIADANEWLHSLKLKMGSPAVKLRQEAPNPPY
jgi:pimeloyl-ACP methyl ester carboxylesterase